VAPLTNPRLRHGREAAGRDKVAHQAGIPYHFHGLKPKPSPFSPALWANVLLQILAGMSDFEQSHPSLGGVLCWTYSSSGAVSFPAFPCIGSAMKLRGCNQNRHRPTD
jgi:hypothetical protein